DGKKDSAVDGLKHVADLGCNALGDPIFLNGLKVSWYLMVEFWMVRRRILVKYKHKKIILI
ncbi:MAG: hypothetical protein IIT65_14225, partial [Lachnospiraceae bacterium]|nr:hypothetical protein [Lachnospiraceae bacterium]